MRVHLALKTPTANTTPDLSPRQSRGLCPPLDLSKWSGEPPRMNTIETSHQRNVHQLNLTPKPTSRTFKTEVQARNLDMSPKVVQIKIDQKQQQLIESKCIPNTHSFNEPLDNSLSNTQIQGHKQYLTRTRRPVTSHTPLHSPSHLYTPAIKRIINQNAKPINVALPFANFDLFEPQWWQYYQGECIGNVRNGHGLLQLTNGQKFIGSFADGKASGNGTFYRLDGQIVFGMWKNNRILKRLV